VEPELIGIPEKEKSKGVAGLLLSLVVNKIPLFDF